MGYRLTSGFGLFLAAAGLIAATPEATAADFYAGKQIQLIVGADAGGVYDVYARVVARHMGKHIPGNPTFVVQNMVGTGGIKMANYMATTAPRDGTAFGAGFNAIPTAPLTSPKEATFDATQFSWVGNATKELYVGYVWNTVPIKTFSDALTKEVIMGGSAVGTFSVDMAVLANEFFGTKFKLVIGYKSSPDTQMAVEKGEVHGVMGTSWGAVKLKKDWMANNSVRVIVQYGLTRDPQFPDVELYIDHAKNEEQRQAIKFMIGNLIHGKPYFAPPGVPADRLAILRDGFEQTMKDPDFLKEVQAAGLEINEPMNGKDLQALVGEEAKTPKAVIDRIGAIVEKFKQSAGGK